MQIFCAKGTPIMYNFLKPFKKAPQKEPRTEYNTPGHESTRDKKRKNCNSDTNGRGVRDGGGGVKNCYRHGHGDL